MIVGGLRTAEKPEEANFSELLLTKFRESCYKGELPRTPTTKSFGR
jgi:hypothetical protein